jgi:hypothetical protein
MSADARTTGWAAIAFAIVYIGTFVSNMVLAMLGPASGIRYKTPDQMIADRLSGDVGAIGFALMGATLIVVAIGLRRLIWDEDSIVGTAASSVGAIAGAGLMLTGAAIGAARARPAERRGTRTQWFSWPRPCVRPRSRGGPPAQDAGACWRRVTRDLAERQGTRFNPRRNHKILWWGELVPHTGLPVNRLMRLSRVQKRHQRDV